MTKTEFLKNLKMELSSLDLNLITTKINYYDNYIDEEMKKGKTEEEVVEALGDPRLIAKTILEVEDNNSYIKKTKQEKEKQDFNKHYSEYKNYRSDNDRSFRGYPYFYSTNGIGCILILIIIFIIVSIILNMVGYVAISGVKLLFVNPILFLLIVLIIYLIYNKRR